MDDLDVWRLLDELTIFQAALLFAGFDPSSEYAHVEDWRIEDQPTAYVVAKKVITQALATGQVEGVALPLPEHDCNSGVYIPMDGTADFRTSWVNVESLKKWLSGREVCPKFFFPEGSNSKDYLDPNHERYAPKLAAVVHAWLAMEDETLWEGGTPKQALEKWLTENAGEFEICDVEGNPAATTIEFCAKVANWQPKGGAPSTPGRKPE